MGERVAVAWRWLYARWGQMVCFWLGGIALFLPGDAPVMDRVPVAAILLATGLALKALSVWKARP